MKSLKEFFKKIKTSLKSEKNSQKSIDVDSKDQTNQIASLNSFFLNEHNRKILKRYNKPVVKELPEREKIFIEVRDVLDDIEARLRNSETDD